MIDARQNNALKTTEFTESKIPSQFAEQIRRYSHDLSNALEVVLQTNYLLGMTEGNLEDSRKWREMLEKGVAQASHVNRQLRDYVRANS
jgi:hypothetical protein